MSIKFVKKHHLNYYYLYFQLISHTRVENKGWVSFFEAPHKSAGQSFLILATAPSGENYCKIGRICVTLSRILMSILRPLPEAAEGWLGIIFWPTFSPKQSKNKPVAGSYPPFEAPIGS
jgi:hypothetical protein